MEEKDEEVEEEEKATATAAAIDITGALLHSSTSRQTTWASASKLSQCDWFLKCSFWLHVMMSRVLLRSANSYPAAHSTRQKSPTPSSSRAEEQMTLPTAASAAASSKAAGSRQRSLSHDDESRGSGDKTD